MAGKPFAGKEKSLDLFSSQFKSDKEPRHPYKNAWPHKVKVHFIEEKRTLI